MYPFLQKKKVKKKRKKAHNTNLERQISYLDACASKDEKRFYIYFRMASKCCDEVLGLLTDDIRKFNTNYHEAILPEELRYELQ